MNEREKKDENERKEPQALEDLDVPERDGEDVKGGGPIHTYSIQNAWPRKWSG
jgi:hypothetical protein